MKKVYNATISIPKERAHFIEERLENAVSFIQENMNNGMEGLEIEDLFSDIDDEFKASFEDGSEMVIHVCAANPPYVDATVYGKDFRIDSLEPSEMLLGKWSFIGDETTYSVDVFAV